MDWIVDSILGKRKEEEVDTSSSQSSSIYTQEEEEEVFFEETPTITKANFEKATLGQLLTKIIPDADIHCPNVIIVGGQSSGKTKMIISMVFHHLIDNSDVTDPMGEQLLRIFRTGVKMVTRRPTRIDLRKPMSDNHDPCNITLKLGERSANFNEPGFDEIVSAVHAESLVRDNNAYSGELRVVITAPDLPNITFTDLPGLVTEDRQLSDSQEISIRKMVQGYMRRPNSTLVVVEPATTEDYFTSQVAPMLRDMKQKDQRRNIFHNSVLVLSKCDKIRQGLEQRIVRMLDLSAPLLTEDFPFRHVVGVINKVGDDEEAAVPDTVTYAEFKEQLRATKAAEMQIFADYKKQDGGSIDPNTQCTTAAVFYQMDRISFDMVHRSISDGMASIDQKLLRVEADIVDRLAPPLEYYETDTTPTTASTSTATTALSAATINATTATSSSEPDMKHRASGSVDANTATPAGVEKSKRLAFVDQVHDNLQMLLSAQFKDMLLYRRPAHADVTSLQASQNAFLASLGVKWPNFRSGDMDVSRLHAQSLEAVRVYFSERFLDDRVVSYVKDFLHDPLGGCFSELYSKFHRIDRFPKLVHAVRESLESQLPLCLAAAKAATAEYLQHFWKFELPRGVDRDGVVRLLEELKHVALREVTGQLLKASQSQAVKDLVMDDGLFEEDPAFHRLRAEHHSRWQHLRKQQQILVKCKDVRDNAQLRVALQQAYEEETSPERSQISWNGFWTLAEAKAFPDTAAQLLESSQGQVQDPVAAHLSSPMSSATSSARTTASIRGSSSSSSNHEYNSNHNISHHSRMGSIVPGSSSNARIAFSGSNSSSSSSSSTGSAPSAERRTYASIAGTASTAGSSAAVPSPLPVAVTTARTTCTRPYAEAADTSMAGDALMETEPATNTTADEATYPGDSSQDVSQSQHGHRQKVMKLGRTKMEQQQPSKRHRSDPPAVSAANAAATAASGATSSSGAANGGRKVRNRHSYMDEDDVDTNDETFDGAGEEEEEEEEEEWNDRNDARKRDATKSTFQLNSSHQIPQIITEGAATVAGFFARYSSSAAAAGGSPSSATNPPAGNNYSRTHAASLTAPVVPPYEDSLTGTAGGASSSRANRASGKGGWDHKKIRVGHDGGLDVGKHVSGSSKHLAGATGPIPSASPAAFTAGFKMEGGGEEEELGTREMKTPAGDEGGGGGAAAGTGGALIDLT